MAYAKLQTSVENPFDSDYSTRIPCYIAEKALDMLVEGGLVCIYWPWYPKFATDLELPNECIHKSCGIWIIIILNGCVCIGKSRFESGWVFNANTEGSYTQVMYLGQTDLNEVKSTLLV